MYIYIYRSACGCVCSTTGLLLCLIRSFSSQDISELAVMERKSSDSESASVAGTFAGASSFFLPQKRVSKFFHNQTCIEVAPGIFKEAVHGRENRNFIDPC